MRRRLVALGAIAGVFLIAVIAIAGGDDSEDAPITTVGDATDTTPATQAKSDFIKQADALCGEANAARETLAAQAAGDPTAAAPEETQLAESEFDQLRTLPAPDSGQRPLKRFFRALRDQVRALEGRELALEREDAAALAEADAALATAEADAQAAAEAFGFKVCGDPEASPDIGGEETAPATEEPVAPAPTDAVPTPEPTPVEPETGGGATPGTDTGAGGDSGGTSSGSGGVSP